MDCNITPESKLQAAAFRPRLWVTFIDIYSLPMSFYYFFSLQDFVSTTYNVFSIAFLTSGGFLTAHFQQPEWSGIAQPHGSWASSIDSQTLPSTPWLLGAGAYRRTWEGCRMNMGLVTSGIFITALYG